MKTYSATIWNINKWEEVGEMTFVCERLNARRFRIMVDAGLSYAGRNADYSNLVIWVSDDQGKSCFQIHFNTSSDGCRIDTQVSLKNGSGFNKEWIPYRLVNIAC